MIIGGVSLVVIGGVVFIASRRIGNLEKLCAVKDVQIGDLSHKCDVLSHNCDIKSTQIDQLMKREKDLMELCKRKDICFDAVISDGLKHGSPLAARHMAEKKAMINEILKAAA